MHASIEVYLLTNFMLDMALLTVVARSCGVFKLRRILIASVLCALYALLAAWKPNPWSSPFIQIGLLIPLSMLVSGRTEIRLWSATGLLLLSGVMLAGGAERLAPNHSRSAGLITTLAGLIILSLLLSLRRRIRTTWYIELCVAAGGNTTRFQALIDTGNRLREPISGLPVLIAEEHLLSKILPETGYRAVAFGALGGGGMLKCFHPDGIWAVTRHGLSATPDVWIAVSPGRLPGTTQALAPGEFLTLSSH